MKNEVKASNYKCSRAMKVLLATVRKEARKSLIKADHASQSMSREIHTRVVPKPAGYVGI